MVKPVHTSMAGHYFANCITPSRFIVGCVVLLALLMISRQAPADDVAKYDIRLARQPLLSAMWELSKQADASIVSDDADVAKIMVGPVVGELSLHEALLQLLGETGFTFEVRDPRTYEIRRATVIYGPTIPPAHSGIVDEVLITGRSKVTVYSSRINELRLGPPPAMFEEGSLDKFGIATVGEFLNYVPSQLNALPEVSWGDGAQFADLRGFGMDMATALINGRWVPPTATSGLAFDLNTIPLTAVERVEVLHESAAAAMGVRAIGGVVNVVLKRTHASPTARIEYGTSPGGGAQRQLSLSAGSESATLKSSLSVDYFERDELPGKARSFSRDQDFRPFGGSDWRSRASWPGNISSISGASLAGLSSSYAAVPVGTNDGYATIGDFQGTAGQYTLDSSRRFSSIVPAARRLSFAGYLERLFPNFKAFVEVLGARRVTDHQFVPPSLRNVLVPANNPFNPFHEAVYSSRLLREIEPRVIVTTSELLRVVAGLNGELDSWDWEVTALTSQESASRWANNALDLERVTNALASTDPRQTLNVFTDGPIGSPELIASLVAAPSSAKFRSIGSELAATLSGPLFEVPAGHAKALLAAQWRKESTSSTRTVTALQAELRLPLWTEKLEASVGARSDDFSDVGRMITPSYSLTWKPFDSLQLRGFYGENLRVPSRDELFGPTFAMQVPVADLQRHGEVANVTANLGSSAELQPVKSKSMALSATFTPRHIPGLEFGSNFWATRVMNRIMPAPLALVLEHEAEFADYITRDDPTPQDRDAGLPGMLRSIDLAPPIFGGLEASGVDANVSYLFNTSVGAFKSEVSATWMRKFATFDVPGAQPTDRIGIANPRGTIPRCRTIAAISWWQRSASASASVRYITPYDDTSGGRRTGRSVRPRPLFDLQASLDLDQFAPGTSVLRGFTLTAGALNVLNTPPQFAEAGQDVGFDASLSDSRQRFWYLRLEKHF